MKKQTAANTIFLKGVKQMMNQKIYQRTLELFNTPGGDLSGGEKQALVYLQQFFRVPVSVEYFVIGYTTSQLLKRRTN